jgi:hypothetical protein
VTRPDQNVTITSKPIVRGLPTKFSTTCEKLVASNA